MKCEQCGFIPNPGDQICMNCGAKLSIKNAVMPGIEKVEYDNLKKTNTKKIIIITISSILLVALIIFIIIKFLILKG